MKQEDWQAAYGPIPDALSSRVSSTLFHLNQEGKVMKRSILRTVCLALCAALLLFGTALALVQSDLLDAIARWDKPLSQQQQTLLKTDFQHSTFMAGDVQITLREMLTDGYVGAVAIEYRAPEGTYLYSDLVPMTEQEWEMSTLDYLNAYGPYYRLLDANVQFVKASETQPISTEFMMDGQRIAPNIIREQIYFSVWEKPVQQVQFDLGAMFISSEDESTDITYAGVIAPNYAPDTTAPQNFHLTFDPATNACALASMDVTFTELVTVFSAQLQNKADAIYQMQVYDANGNQLCYTSLSSLIGESYQNSVINSYDAMSEIPDVLSVQFYQLDPDTGTQTTVGEPITLRLK